MPLLIAVGGTGQHIALTLARLALVGAVPWQEWEVLVLDADTSSGLPKKLQDAAGWTKAGMAHPLNLHPIRAPFDSQAAANTDTRTVPKILLGEHQEDALSNNVVQALFTNNALKQDVSEGFFAKPMLGASSFAAQGESLVSHINETSRNHGRVFVAGSLVGGTGAGVLPRLVERCAKREGNSRWFGCFVFRWISTGTESQGQGTSDTQMENNRRHSAHYFTRHIRPKLTSSLLIGPAHESESPPDVWRATPASDVGEETLSPLIAAACTGIHKLLNDSQTTFNVEDVRTIGVPATRGWLGSQLWSDMKSLDEHLKHVSRAMSYVGYLAEGPLGEELPKAFGLLGGNGVPRGLVSAMKTSARSVQDQRVKPAELVPDVIEILGDRRRRLNAVMAELSKTFAARLPQTVSDEDCLKWWQSQVAALDLPPAPGGTTPFSAAERVADAIWAKVGLNFHLKNTVRSNAGSAQQEDA